MRPFKFAAAVLLALMVWGAGAAPALAQRYVPLRYDLRAPPQRYMPGLPYNLYPYASYGYGSYGPEAVADPYSYDAIRQRNYIVTGNVRAGKSFQGHTPYSDVGDQLNSNLPTMRLSNFRRDSVGVEDLGTGVEYGLPLPYFPQTAQVTSAGTTGQRFAPGEYYPTPYVSSYGMDTARLSPEAYIRPEDQIAIYSPEAYLPPGGAAGIPSNLALPETFWQQFEAYASEELPAPSPEQVWNTEGADTSAYGLMGATPQNIYDPLRAAQAQEQARQPSAQDSLLYGLASSRTPSAEPAPGEATDEVLPQYVSSGAIPWVGTGSIVKEVTVATPSPYAEWVRQAHEAMNQGNYKEAEGLYDDALALDPSRSSALFGRIHALIGLGYYNQSALVLARYLAKHPDWAQGPPDVSKAFTQEGVYDRAVESLQQTLKAQPASAPHNFLLGYMLYAAGQKAEARPYLEAAAAAADKRAAAQVLLDAIAAAPIQNSERGTRNAE